MVNRTVSIFTFLAVMTTLLSAQAPRPAWGTASSAKLLSELTARYGPAVKDPLRRGMEQVLAHWKTEDGEAAAFEDLVRTYFAGDAATRDALFTRTEELLEQLYGHLQEVGREFRQQVDLDRGPILPFDEIFAGYAVGAHVSDDFFRNRLAFVVLLNFPLTTLEERLNAGASWSRREWAEVRLAQQFAKRVPASVNLEMARLSSDANRYVAEYNIYMHHLLSADGSRLFPAKLRLLSHWNLRDEIKADYGDDVQGLAKQRMIQQVMERIVTQTVPLVVINSPAVDWDPAANTVRPAAVTDVEPAKRPAMPLSNAPEPDSRYAMLLSTFHASQLLDPYSPTGPTLIARRFDENREIPEQRVRAILESVLSSPVVPKVAALIQKRLGRPLEPFDIWYDGFRPRSRYTEAQLDEIVAKRYPTAEAYRWDIPNMLRKLGFRPALADEIAANIVVDPARGSGHAMGATMRSAHAHLRTRVGSGGMNYKGFNIAVHEMGHNVEQTLSLNHIDHYLLNGVPNTAFTEAIAFVFQARDLELLGLSAPDEQAEALKMLNDFWGTYEIAGVALVDMAVWHWMYDHPAATPAELKKATLRIAAETWNSFYAPVFGKKDVLLLAVYSHMIDSYMYLPDYPLGHLIAQQIEEQVKKGGSVGPEIERMVQAGSIAPDLWMKNATGHTVDAEAMLLGAEQALRELTH